MWWCDGITSDDGRSQVLHLMRLLSVMCHIYIHMYGVITADEMVCPDSEGFVSLEWENVRCASLSTYYGSFLSVNG